MRKLAELQDNKWSKHKRSVLSIILNIAMRKSNQLSSISSVRLSMSRTKSSSESKKKRKRLPKDLPILKTKRLRKSRKENKNIN